MSLLRKLLFAPFGPIVYMVSYWLPKKKNRFVIGAWHGKRYADSSKYFFEYVLKNHPEIEIWWITKSNVVYKALIEKNYPVLKAFNPYAWWIVATARVAFISISARDILTYIITSRHFIVQLWHGIPIKKVGLASLRKHFFLYWGIRLCPWYNLKYGLFPVTSAWAQQLFTKSFHLSTDLCPILGTPRNVPLLNRANVNKSEQVFLYAPTYRKTADYLKDFFECLPVSEDMLSKLNVLLKVRMHLSNIRFLDKNNINYRYVSIDAADDPQEILATTRVLITDFSSMAFDYLLLDRPIIFYVPDLPEYQNKERELYFNFSEFAPGPIVYSWKEVLEELHKIVIHGEDMYKAKRHHLLNQIYQYQDGRDCERIFMYLSHQLEKI